MTKVRVLYYAWTWIFRRNLHFSLYVHPAWQYIVTLSIVMWGQGHSSTALVTLFAMILNSQKHRNTSLTLHSLRPTGKPTSPLLKKTAFYYLKKFCHAILLKHDVKYSLVRPFGTPCWRIKNTKGNQQSSRETIFLRREDNGKQTGSFN